MGLTRLAFILLTVLSFAQEYHKQYPVECEYAVKFYGEYKIGFDNVAEKTNLDSKFVFSIVAPEITQFNYLSNIAETYSLKVLYVQGGKNYSDFSIGYFQMKPSFIEEIESFLNGNENLRNKYIECLIDKTSERATRVERVKKLESVEWQLKYLSVFCDILKFRFGYKKFDNENDKLRFYAAAYNTGFHRSQSEIEKISQLPQFPHFSNKKYNYSEISLWFYNKCQL